MDLTVTRDVMEAMRAAAREAHPCEACGILLGKADQIVRLVNAPNVHPSPETHFEIDPQTLIDVHRGARDGESQVVGYFHSHPAGPAEPSATDCAMAARDGAIWAIYGQIGASFGVRFFRAGEGGFEELPMPPQPS